jgi:hypothetical protein
VIDIVLEVNRERSFPGMIASFHFKLFRTQVLKITIGRFLQMFLDVQGDEQFRMSVDVRMPSKRTGGSFANVAFSFHTTFAAEIESVFHSL